jgi:hypothetical protein
MDWNLDDAGATMKRRLIIIWGSRLVKHMGTCYKANDDSAKPILSTFSSFGGQISAVVAAVLSGYGSH